MLCFLAITLVLSITVAGADNFWITAKTVNFEFNDDCLANSCFRNQLVLRMVHLKTDPRQVQSTEFALRNVHYNEEFTSFWKQGSPDEVDTQMSIINYDPTFGFPRECDSGPWMSMQNVSHSPETNLTDEIFGLTTSKTFKIRGRCFNATVVLEKHTKQCPWCPDAEALFDRQVAASAGGDNDSLWERLYDPLFFWPIIIATFLAFVVFFLALTLACAVSRSGFPQQHCGASDCSSTLSKSHLMGSTPSQSTSSVGHDSILIRYPLPPYPAPQLPYHHSVDNGNEQGYECLSVHRSGEPAEHIVPIQEWSEGDSYVSTPANSIINV